MKRITSRIGLVLSVLGLLPAAAAGQPFAAAGTRAAGMGGAFTGVADDASAIYWNPAGLAAGAIVSVVLDLGQGTATPKELGTGREGSSFLLALSTPALGLGYYRLRSTGVHPGFSLLPNDELASARHLSVAGGSRVDSLVTHHAGVTVVQSIVQGVAVGSTLKLVRGIAGTQTFVAVDPETALDRGADLLGRATNRFDLDVGVMAYGGPLKAGLAVRNVREPGFPTPGEDARELVLERQARAGVSYQVSRAWLASADLELTRTSDVFGDRREAAFGVEGLLGRRVWARSGLRFNTVGSDEPIDDRRGAAYSVGGSYAARAGVLIDGHFTAGSGRGGREWGVAARFVY